MPSSTVIDAGDPARGDAVARDVTSRQERAAQFERVFAANQAALVRREAVSLDDDGGLPGGLMATSAAAESEAADDQERRRLLDAVRRLPVIYREVTVLMLEGMEYQEIADVVGISETNVGVRLNRARRKLQRMLGEDA